MKINYNELFPQEYRVKHQQRYDAIDKAHTADDADEARL